VPLFHRGIAVRPDSGRAAFPYASPVRQTASAAGRSSNKRGRGLAAAAVRFAAACATISRRSDAGKVGLAHRLPMR
jgi:hypothetical protein